MAGVLDILLNMGPIEDSVGFQGMLESRKKLLNGPAETIRVPEGSVGAFEQSITAPFCLHVLPGPGFVFGMLCAICRGIVYYSVEMGISLAHINTLRHAASSHLPSPRVPTPLTFLLLPRPPYSKCKTFISCSHNTKSS